MLCDSASVVNKTTWDTKELMAFVGKAAALSQNDYEMIHHVEFKIFRINPTRKKKLVRYDDPVPTLSVKCDGPYLYVSLPSPRLYVDASPLMRLARAAEDRLAMPDAARRALFLTLCKAMSNGYDRFEDTATLHRPIDHRWDLPVEELPPITTKAVGVRATPKRTLADWQKRANEIYYARCRAEDRLYKLEQRVARLRALEKKLDAKVDKLLAREVERKAKREERERKRRARNGAPEGSGA